jgi:hypothetical protein
LLEQLLRRPTWLIKKFGKLLNSWLVKRLYFLALCILPLQVFCQEIHVRGTVKDRSGELLPLASLVVLPDSIITTSDIAGVFNMRISRGDKTFYISYTGYQQLKISSSLWRDTTISFELIPTIEHLKEVLVEAEQFSHNDIMVSTRSGIHRISQEDISNIPALMGEADIIKVVQLLPGSVKGVEGSSDVFVRGGASDQNLVLLDGAPIYNTNHMFGFLSVFNPDIVDNVEAINGGFPAEFGGRLSSVMNVSTISRMPDKTSVAGEVGLVSSRLKISQPILKDKASFWVAARRTYVDHVMKAIGKNLPYYFYDLNGKMIYNPTNSDRIEISHYGGEDVLDLFKDKNHDGNGMLTTYNAQNMTQSMKWNHFNPNGWRSDLSVFRTHFDYRIKNAFEDYAVSASSEIEDLGTKISFSKDSLWFDGTMTTGVEWIRHAISPNVINSKGSIAETVKSGSTDGKIANEFALYLQHEWAMGKNVIVNSGFRTSVALVDNKQYVFPEPRISLRYNLGKDRAFKFNYSRMVQYMHRISNSGISTPTDVWYPVTDSIRPQAAHQFAIGWQRFLNSKKLFLNVESYYKSMNDLIAYQEGTNLLLNTEFASRLIQGRGKSYGIEVLLRKDAGRFTGWISYTLSWSFRKYDEVNGGQWFRARYDRRHNGAIITQYTLAKRWAVSMVFEYISGARFTPVVGQYVVGAPNLAGVDLVPVFSKINAVKLSDSHRLDLGVKFLSKPGKKFRWHCFAGVYNAYNRASPIGIVIEKQADGNLRYAQPGLFGLLPFVSYGFKF